MKYGKRLRARAVKGWLAHYIDYKGLKKFIKDDITNDTPEGTFQVNLQAEIDKVNEFFAQKEAELWEMYKPLALAVQQHKTRPAGLPSFCRALNDLRNFVVLNYFAVIKIVKKWNKKTPSHWPQMDAFVVLRNQPFYQSPRLSTLTVRAELLALELSPPATLNRTDWSCPICQELLRNPVALDCTHRFCWTCLFKASEQLDCCPVCGKGCLLDGPNMQVDWILTAFLQKNFPENPQLPVDSWESLRERMLQAASECDDLVTSEGGSVEGSAKSSEKAPESSESSPTNKSPNTIPIPEQPLTEDLCSTIRALKAGASVDTQPEVLLQKLEKQLGIALGSRAAKELLDLLTTSEKEQPASESSDSQQPEREESVSSPDGIPLPLPAFLPARGGRPHVTASVEPWLEQQARLQLEPASPPSTSLSTQSPFVAQPVPSNAPTFCSEFTPPPRRVSPGIAHPSGRVVGAPLYAEQGPPVASPFIPSAGWKPPTPPVPVPSPQPLDQAGRDQKATVDPRKYKTQMCRSWMQHGCCTYAETCCFAHGQEELRTIADNHRTLASIGYFSNLLLVAMSNSNKPALPPHLLYQQPAMFPEPKSAKELDLYSRLLPEASAFPFQQPLQAAFSELRKNRKGKKKGAGAQPQQHEDTN
eukprot:TRINITY_DN30674_c0_g1_i1.p1 TRINITY_DN30674_c0_g1~~TRINITY_DN30674_c0_g1_i1.p1  ORF type:complete len:645 (+),score=82.09 TRINITY_DN30674_c0_g1_i1:29-1963(+)